ncbi:S41 family peptidase [Bacillus sp. DTU_2020_1000418_1_SI_GHA_SEK_038]|uniref:S41 family peptidase n=1 Tax=Bacillus sp. DTU_2020_1000418_1_SI_GHA_SEK_038 TaxID=3077585 RepID=UPI0028E2DA32|nr:S41 family peptidase [Bacillus sp. DTU_2020_1000418_1_SI_GHA_SEK_038]WNS74590.1 S41 family peptidase [Bacillus sp. DTU_2020_1000418_1_SI_GHA_SEK_038]
MKKKTKTNIVAGVASFFSILVILFLVDILKGENKLNALKQDIIYDYYDEENLQKVLKDRLGDAYEDDLQTDFDNFTISLVLEELAKFEINKNKEFNSFLDKEWLQGYNEENKNLAEEIAGKPIDKSTYYLKLTTFQEGGTYKELTSLIQEFSKYDNLIIDLRDNTGGSFKELEKVLTMFMKKDTLLFQLKTRDDTEKYYSNNKSPVTFQNIVVLTNNRTASSSELLIVSLKENLEHVTQIGTHTYGKNIGLSIRTFNDESGMVFISSVMEGPNSKKLDENGLAPDIEVMDKAKQLETAIDFLASQKQ